jgi:hypothetical protein
VQGADNVLLGYYKVTPTKDGIKLNNKDLGEGKKLNVSYNGFYDSCPISGMGGETKLFTHAITATGQNGTFKKVKKEGWQGTWFFQYDYNLGTDVWNGFNRHFAIGRRHFYGKTYKFGFGWGLDWNRLVAKNSLGVNNRTTTMRQMQFRLELLQRIVFHRIGVNWDLGAYGGINTTYNVKIVDRLQFAEPDPTYNYDPNVTTLYIGCKAMNTWEYGATTRLSYTFANAINVGVYGSYRFSNIITKPDVLIGNTNPSPWSFGIEIEIMP